jgi:hypothetical protein
MNLTEQDKHNLEAFSRQFANCTVGLVVGKRVGSTFIPDAPLRVLLPDGTERVTNAG